MSQQVFSNNKAHRGGYLLYINGIEVPCPALSITLGVWQLPTATLSMAPHYLLERLGAEDKVSVVIFYWDDFYDGVATWRLIFEGEIVGWSYGNNAGQRVMQFDCVCDLATYQQIYYFFMNSADSMADSATNTSNDSDHVGQGGVHYPYSLFKQGLLSSSAEPPPDVNGPFDILENVLKGMVASTLPPSRRAIPAINFFGKWVRRRNLINRFVALPYFEDDTDNRTPGVFSIFKAAKSAYAVEAMQTSLSQSVGEAGSLLDVIKTVFGAVFYELAMIPNMPLVKADLPTGKILGDPNAVTGNNPNLEPLRINNYFAKPQATFAIPPSCNVFFKHTGVQFRENFATQPTRTYVNDAFYSGLPNMGNQQTTYALTVGFPPQVNAVLKEKQPQARKVEAAKNAPDPVASGRNVLVWPEEFFKGAVVNRSAVPKWYTMLLNDTRSEEERADIQHLFELYSAYEHYRARYEKRGGSTSMHFNPYAVPGFPCITFDSDPPGIHTAGYVMSLTHSFSTRGMNTNVGFSFGRTLREYLNLCRDESIRLGGVLGSGPADPVDESREITQDFDMAEKFYNALFHQRKPMKDNKKASFDFREILGYLKDDGTIEPITLTGPSQADINRQFRAGSNADTATSSSTTPANLPPVKSNIDDSRVIVPQAGFQGAFDSYDTAMSYVSRPIATLDEYVRFIHGGASLQDLKDAGILIQEGDYYSQIRVYTPVTAATVPPTPAQAGASVGNLAPGLTLPSAEAYTGAPEATPYNFPDVRLDWSKLLRAYRIEMRKTAPQQ